MKLVKVVLVVLIVIVGLGACAEQTFVSPKTVLKVIQK